MIMTTNEQIKDLRERLVALEKCLNMASRREEVARKTEKTLAPDFWSDAKEAEKFLKELSALKFWVVGYDKAATAVDDLDVLYEFAKESTSLEGDEMIETAEVKELDVAYASACEQVEALELRNMLGAEGDNLGAVLTINSGAGGTEANDW